MTTTAPHADIDEARVQGLVGQILTDLAGAAATATTVVGDRLGLYRAMAGAGRLTAPALATATGLNERLVTEWLAAQTVSRYVLHDEESGTFELPAEHAAVLADPASPAYVVAAGEVVAAQYATLEHLQRAMADGGGIHFDLFPAAMHSGVERFFRTPYSHELHTSWFPAVPGLVERLEAGARVADVGCGHGAATLLMAHRWPGSTFVGLDFHEPAIATARARATEAGATGNVSFRVADATDLGAERFDVVVYFDALQVFRIKEELLRRAHDALVDGGVVVAVEPWSTDRLEEGIGNPVVRLNYAVSTSVCTPASLGQPGGYALGTQGGPARRLQLLADAGFRNPVVAADTGFNLVFAATR